MTNRQLLDAAITERDFQAQILQYATVRKWHAYHTFDSRRSQAGFPDLVLVRGPRLIFAEIKSEHGRMKAEQEDWLNRLQRTPAEAYIWRPSNWDVIEGVLT